jgi:hypothetical protein
LLALAFVPKVRVEALLFSYPRIGQDATSRQDFPSDLGPAGNPPHPPEAAKELPRGPLTLPSPARGEGKDVEIQKEIPSPSMGEGSGGGENGIFSHLPYIKGGGFQRRVGKKDILPSFKIFHGYRACAESRPFGTKPNFAFPPGGTK